MGAAYSQTGVLAKGRAEGSAGEIEELGRELGLAGARRYHGLTDGLDLHSRQTTIGALNEGGAGVGVLQ